MIDFIKSHVPDGQSRAILYSMAALGAISIAAGGYHALTSTTSPPQGKPPIIAHVQPPASSTKPEPARKPEPPRDEAKIRLAAWAKITPKLRDFDEGMKQEVEQSAKLVKEFFIEREKGAGAFASDVLSEWGKFAYARGLVDPKSHEAYLQDCFSRHIMKTEELSKLVESTVSQFISEMKGRESRLLVEIRADLNDEEIAAFVGMTSLRDNADFSHQFEQMILRVVPIVENDAKVAVSSAIVSYVASEIIEKVTLKIGAEMAARLGLSAGILGAGATTSTVSFGISMVIGRLIDEIIKWAIREAGHDPEVEIASKVLESLDSLQVSLLDGYHPVNPWLSLAIQGKPGGSGADHAKQYDDKWGIAASMKQHDSSWGYMAGAEPKSSNSRADGGSPDPAMSARLRNFGWARGPSDSDSEKKRSNVDELTTESKSGLRYELRHLIEVRSRLREAALKKLVLEGGVQ